MTGTRQAKRDRFLAAARRGPILMGILNVTPDSFSDGGLHLGEAAALRQAHAMAEKGCAIIDIGGESTRPGSQPVPEAEELARIVPALRAVCAALDLPVSIDTTKAGVAREAARLGASVINDVWGLQRDPAMAATVAETEAAVVIMHNRESADASLDILDEIRCFFDRSLALAEAAGVPRAHILLDPGIGFGKTPQQSLDCLARLDRLADYGLPILLGASRKSFLGRLLGRPVEDRLIGSVAAHMVGAMKGARVLRVHDVAAHRDALAVLRATGMTP